MKKVNKILKRCLALVIASSMISVPMTNTAAAAALTPTELATKYATPTSLQSKEIKDYTTGRTYNLLTLSGTDIVRPYFTAQQWNSDATKFIFGVADGADNTNGAMLEYDTETGKARFLDYADVSTNRLEAYVNPQDKIFYEKFNSEGVTEYWVMDWSTYQTSKIAQLPEGIKWGRNVVATNDGNYMSVQWQNADEEGDSASVLARLDVNTGEFYTDRSHKFADGKLRHPMINPANKDLMMFCHEGDDAITADRIWIADMTGASRPWTAFMQSRDYVVNDAGTEETIVTEPVTHEVWQGNGEAIVFVKNKNDNTKGEYGLARVKPNGSDREYFPNPDKYELWHVTPSFDGNFIAGDAKPSADDYARIVLYDTRTYEQWCLARFDPGTAGNDSDKRGWAYDPYQFHPTMSNDASKICWEMYEGDKFLSKSVYGVAWMDISDITNRTVNGGVTSYSDKLNYVSYSGSDFEVDVEEYQGKESIHIPRDGKFYIDVKDSLGKSMNADGTLTFKYYDSGTSDIIVKYTSAIDTESDMWKQEDKEEIISCTDTNTWIEKTINLDDISLSNSCKHLTDLVICADNQNICDIDFEFDLDENPAYDNKYLSVSGAGETNVTPVTTATWWRNGTTLDAETVNLGRSAIKVKRGNNNSLVVKFNDNLKALDTVKVSFDVWGTCQWQQGTIRYVDAKGERKDEKKLQVNDFRGWKHYEYEVSTDYNLASYGYPLDRGFAITYEGNNAPEELWIANLKVDVNNEWSIDTSALVSENGYTYSDSQLKVLNNSDAWTVTDKPMWWNTQSGAGQYVEKQLDENVFVINRGDNKYFVVTFGDQIKANNIVNVGLNLWGTYRWQNGSIIYKGADGEIKDEQIGVKFDHFEPYSKTMKTDFDLKDYGLAGKTGFVIVYKGSSEDDKLWVKDIKVTIPETKYVEITANSAGTGYTEMLPCGKELTGTNGNAISGQVHRDGSYGLGYQYKNVNGVDAFYLTQMYDDNASKAVDVVKGYLGFKVDTDKFAKSPTAEKNLYLVTEYFDGTVGNMQTRTFEISYTAKSWNWANSSATNVSMSNDNTWKTHIMPLGDIYFGVTNSADSAAITYRIPTANDGYNKNGILIKRVAVVDEAYLNEHYDGAGKDGATILAQTPDVIYEKYDSNNELEYKIVSLNSSSYDSGNERFIIGRPGKLAIVFGEKYTSQDSPINVSFNFTGARQWQNGTFGYVDTTGASQSEMVQVDAGQKIRSYSFTGIKPDANNLTIAGNTETGCIIEYTGSGESDYFAVSDLSVEVEGSDVIFEKYDDNNVLEYKVIRNFDDSKETTYNSETGEFKIYRPGKLAVVFGEKYQDANKTYSVSFEFSGAKQWQNGTVNYVQKKADGSFGLKADGVQVGQNAAWRTYTLKNVYTLGKNISGDNFVYLDESGFYIEYPGEDPDYFFLVKNITITEEVDPFASADIDFDEYTIEGFEFAGGEIAPKAGGSVSGVLVRRACPTEPAMKPQILVAAYGENGTLLNVTFKGLDAEISHGGTAVVDVSLPLATGVQSVKAFIFDSISGMKPITKAEYKAVDDNDDITIYLAGDSTVCNYTEKYYPQAGWGQMLGKYFDSEHVTIDNRAIGGRSTKSFIAEDRLDAIAEDIKAGDYLFIQFAHNDQKPDEARHTAPGSTYKDYLVEYIRVARDNGAYPVLVTAPQRRDFNKNGEFMGVIDLAPYYEAVRQVASAYNVPLIELADEWAEVVSDAGAEKAKKYYLFTRANDSRFDSQKLSGSDYANGVTDSTHFNEFGADYMASIIADKIDALNLPVETYLTDYTPAEVPEY